MAQWSRALTSARPSRTQAGAIGVTETVFHFFFLIFTGAALVASLTLYGRQLMLVAYIALGGLIGPYGLGWVPGYSTDRRYLPHWHYFSTFFLGLDMQPQALYTVLRKVTHVTLISSVIFATVGYEIGHLFGFNPIENLIIGLAMIFSSTIIGIKLLPTTILHHRHIGKMIVGLLLMQDFIAIFVLLVDCNA
jgi:Kef-type K+ transport system membrane component KefB